MQKNIRASMWQKFVKTARTLVAETWLTSWELIKITVPVIVVTKILEEFGLISYLSAILEPLMSFVGLPGSLGLVWATAMFTSLYGGIAVFAALAPGLELTVAQVTILCSLMLIAHALPVELSVSKKAGARVLPIALLRLGGAIGYGFLLNNICLGLNIWQDRAVIIFSATVERQTLLQWAQGQLQNLGLIIAIIFCILIVMRLLKAIGFLGLLEKMLSPVLPVFGMGHHAAPVTVVGMVMGIAYGGALIIRETTTGKMARHEVFYSMALMGLCHGLVEDTLLMVAIGGKIAGILWGRIFFSLIVIFIIVRFVKYLNSARLQKSQN